MRITARITDIANEQRGTLLLWAPLGLSLGIGGYFALPKEPGPGQWAALAVLLPVLLLLILRSRRAVAQAVLLALALALAGFLNAGFSANRVAAPVLGWRYYGPVEGRIIAVDRSASDRVRITLDRVRLARVNPERTPRKVRISLLYPEQAVALIPGRSVMLTANLSPPSGPVEPGGFDFRRHAWFLGLGAIGYSRSPVLRPGPDPPGDWRIGLARLRQSLATAIRERVGGQEGAFAAAILTGDRSAIAPDMLQLLRDSNLAHLLAISGLHMGLLTGFVFALARYGLALSSWAALYLPVKKISAVAALGAASAYLVLSGANVATQRAFVMVAVMLVAVLLDRRAVTLRAVALAALIVLAMRPVSLIEAGFQMSFAATTALVAGFGALRGRLGADRRTGLRRLLGGVGALFLSSLIAGLATAPISAAQFNRVAEYGLAANLASVPVMGFLVMPMAVAAILTTPLGLSAPFWAVVKAGIGWILGVAGWIAGLDGAVLTVPRPPAAVLPLLAIGGLGVVALRGWVRASGLLPLLAGAMLWAGVERPSVLVSDNGRLIGVVGREGGRWLNRARGNGFVARNWLLGDGDGARQEAAAARPRPAEGDGAGALLVAADGLRVAYRRDKTMPAAEVATLCRAADVVFLPRLRLDRKGCLVIDRARLDALGAVAVSRGPGGVQLIGALPRAGLRLWSN